MITTNWGTDPFPETAEIPESVCQHCGNPIWFTVVLVNQLPADEFARPATTDPDATIGFWTHDPAVLRKDAITCVVHRGYDSDTGTSQFTAAAAQPHESRS
jgi:hypothetical protein